MGLTKPTLGLQIQGRPHKKVTCSGKEGSTNFENHRDCFLADRRPPKEKNHIRLRKRHLLEPGSPNHASCIRQKITIPITCVFSSSLPSSSLTSCRWLVAAFGCLVTVAGGPHQACLGFQNPGKANLPNKKSPAATGGSCRWASPSLPGVSKSREGKLAKQKITCSDWW